MFIILALALLMEGTAIVITAVTPPTTVEQWQAEEKACNDKGGRMEWEGLGGNRACHFPKKD